MTDLRQAERPGHKVLANKAFIEEILEERDNLFGLSSYTIRGLKKLLKQPQPTPEEYSEIYHNRPNWVHTGGVLSGQRLTNPHTAIQMMWIDVSLIHQILAQSYSVFGLNEDTVLKLISTLETVFRQGVPTPEEYASIYQGRNYPNRTPGITLLEKISKWLKSV